MMCRLASWLVPATSLAAALALAALLVFVGPELATAQTVSLSGCCSYGPAVGGGVVQPAFTWDPTTGTAFTDSRMVLANGNRDVTSATGGEPSARATLPKSSGKWCAEFTLFDLSGSYIIGFGLANSTFDSAQFPSDVPTSFFSSVADTTYSSTGIVRANLAAWSSIMASPTVGDIFTLCADLDTGNVFVGKNGAFGSGQNIVTEANPYLTWTPGGTWNFITSAKFGNPANIRLSATPGGFTYTGYSLLNH